MTPGLQTEFDDASASPGLALWRVTNAWQRAVRAALAPHDLTHVQFVLLASLSWMDGSEPISQQDLARHAGTDAMMTSQVIRALEAKGYVTRSPHPSDRRAIAVATTEAGRAAADRANVDVEAADRAYFSALDAAHLVSFTRALGILDGRI